MADLERRGSYTPRRVREQRAYRLLVLGGATGAVGVVGLVLAAIGVTSAGWPVVLLVVAALCAVLFRGAIRG